MGFLFNLYRKMLPPDVNKMLAWIEREVDAGRMSREEADRRRADLENDLHKFFDSEEEKKQDNA